MRDEVVPAVVERPVRRERCRRCEENSNRSDTERRSHGHGLRRRQLDQPADTETRSERDGDKYRKVVRVLVLRDLVAEVVCEISDDNKRQEPESCSVLPKSSRETRQSKRQRRRQPRRPEFAQQHFEKYNKLRSHHRRTKRQEHPILSAGDVPPDFLERTRIAPVDER